MTITMSAYIFCDTKKIKVIAIIYIIICFNDIEVKLRSNVTLGSFMLTI